MAETADFDPGPWKGYDFKSARANYDVHVNRSYDDAKSKGVDPGGLVPEEITTEATNPLVIVTDVTGSMGEWPATMFSKLPYLELEAKEYLGDDLEICFAAVGDVFSDKYPLQIRPFTSGPKLETCMKELIIEGNGGGQYKESYDIAALYFARNCKMPKAIKPLLIFVGDEGLYEHVAKDHAEQWARVSEAGRLGIEQVIRELKTKFDVFLIRKPYGKYYDSKTNSTNSLDVEIQKQWSDLLGADHICLLPEAGRVVDVIFGILAKVTGREDYFTKELKDRQLKDADGKHKVELVLKTLHTVHKAPETLKKLPARGKSVTKDKSKNSRASKSLMDDDSDVTGASLVD